MEKIRGFFLQKAGPLPVWIWAAIVLAAVLGYMYFTKSGIFAGSSTSQLGNNPQDASGAGSGIIVDPQAGNGGAGLGAGGGAASDTSGSAVAAGGGVSSGVLGLGDYTPAAAPLPGITPAAPRAPALNAQPRQVVYPVATYNEVGQQTSNQVNFNPVRARSSGNQAVV